MHARAPCFAPDNIYIYYLLAILELYRIQARGPQNMKHIEHLKFVHGILMD